jgi:hypothetical protein
VQWKFSDAEPWHVSVDNGSTRAEPGLAEKADVTLNTTWADWINISMHGADFGKAVLRRRMRPRGSVRQLLRLQKIWQPRELV